MISLRLRAKQKQNSALLTLLFMSSVAFAQSEKLLHCKVIADSVSVSGINVVNLVNEKSAVSDAKGEFWILAKAEDLLVLSAVNLEYKRKLIEAEDLKLDLIVIRMIPKINEIAEVIVAEHAEINTTALGIVPAGQKQYTPAERRVKTAGEFKPTFYLGVLGGSLPIDPILNAISRRTAGLKKQLKIEKKEMLLEKLNQWYDADYYTKTLKIPEINVEGFKYFVIEDAGFVSALEAKNKTQAGFSISALAVKYKDLLACEN